MKTDFKREISTYTARPGEFSVVTVPPLDFLMIDGQGDPNTSQTYADAIAAIYPIAYGLKFLSKKDLGHDYAVMPLEGLWWSEDMASFTTERDKSRWEWTLMIMVPDWITRDHVHAVREDAARKRALPLLEAVRLERYDEGLSVQTLHIGSYDDEAPVLEAMHQRFLPSESLRANGKHHEVYLSDARRTAAAKLKTILRQPVARSTDGVEARETG